MSMRNDNFGDFLEKERILAQHGIRLDDDGNIKDFVNVLLDNLDFDFKNYTPSIESIDFFNFVRLVLGQEPENPNSIAHYFTIDMILGNITREMLPYPDWLKPYIPFIPDRFAVLAHREWAKSTILGTMLPLYVADRGILGNRGKVPYMVYIGDSMDNNVKTTMQTINIAYKDSRYMQNSLEEFKGNNSECKFIRKGNDRLRDRQFTLKGFGASTGARGQRSGFDRPKGAIFDDLIKQEKDASSEKILEAIDSTIYSDVLPGLHGGSNFAILIGTPYNENDPVYSAILSGGWTPIVFPVCNKIYEDMPREEWKGIWPERHSYESVMRRYLSAKYTIKNGKNKLRSFNQELMLRIADGDENLVEIDKIETVPLRLIEQNANNYNFVITTDLKSTNVKAKKGDRAGLLLWAIGNNGMKILIKGKLQVITYREQLNYLFDLVKYVHRLQRNVSVGVEIDGNQSLHISNLKNEMIKRAIYFSFLKEKDADGGPKNNQDGIKAQGFGDKFERFKKFAVPEFDDGKIMVSEEFMNSMDGNNLFLDEVAKVTLDGIVSETDDGLDCVSMVCGMAYIEEPTEDNGLNSTTIITSPTDYNSSNPFGNSNSNQEFNIGYNFEDNTSKYWE